MTQNYSQRVNWTRLFRGLGVTKSGFKLGMFDVVMLVISLVIGMGIFRTPATVALRSGDPTLFYLAWITGGVFALAGALTFAEVGRRMPVTGAYYRVFAHAYHPVIAFAVNTIILPPTPPPLRVWPSSVQSTLPADFPESIRR